MQNRRSVIFVFLLIFLIGIISAYNFDDENFNFYEDPPPAITFNNDTGSVNNTAYWVGMDAINTTQMENNGGVLNILESWFSDVFDNFFGAKTTDDLAEGSTNLYDNQSWNEEYADGLYVNVDGDNLTGNYVYNSTYNVYDNNSNIFMYDIDQEYHHVNADLETLDEMLANTFLTIMNQETITNSSGVYLNISSAEDYIAFYIGTGTESQSYKLDYKEVVLKLTEGTNSTPVLNRVYIALSGGVPTWTVATAEPTVRHAMVARILVGEKHIYAASLQEDGQNGFAKRVQRVNRKRGLLYESGLDYAAYTTGLNISSGNFINSIYDQSIAGVNLSQDGFYLVNSTASYEQKTSFSDITKYSSGETIGNNKYYNVVFGLTPYDGYARIYAVVQSSPTADYNSIVEAYADNDNTVSVYPSDDFLRIFFLPVARMIINTQSDEAQLLPNGQYAIDYRGGIAGGVSSGGGISEADPLSIHKDGSVAMEGNFSMGWYSITNLFTALFKDNQGEQHSLARDATEFDNLNRELTLGKITVSQVGENLVINNTDNSFIVVNINGINYNFSSSSLSESLNGGKNYLGFILDGGSITLDNSAAYDDSILRSDVGIINKKDADENYLYAVDPDTNNQFNSKVKERAKNNFEQYISGFSLDGNTNEIIFESGEYWVGLTEHSSTNTLNSSLDKFYVIDSDGLIGECVDLSCFGEYNDGGAISAGSYVNIIWAVVPDSGNTSRLVAIPQNEPTVEYTSPSEAEDDVYKSITFTANDDDVNTYKLVLARTILNASGDYFEQFSSGLYYESQIGLTPAGSAAGGTNDHSLLTNLAWSVAGHTLDTSLIPLFDGASDLGSGDYRWGNIFASGNFSIGNVTSGSARLTILGSDGSAGATLTAATPGQAGMNVTAGTGGEGGSNQPGATGGATYEKSGDGGESTSDQNAGNGGPISKYSGDGGAAPGSYTGGTGGPINLFSGDGGASATGVAGAGGTINITAGDGGQSTNTGGAGGDIILNPGDGKASFISGRDGYVLLAPSRGNVGIRNSNPGEELDVTGDINATGNICVTGSDCLRGLNASATAYTDLVNASQSSWINAIFGKLAGGNSWTGTQEFNGGWGSGGASIINGDGFFQTLYAYNITGLDVNTMNVNGSILPTFDDAFTIGNTSLRYNAIRIGTGDSSFAGKVGIGTSSPEQPLTLAFDNKLLWQSSAGGASTRAWGFDNNQGVTGSMALMKSSTNDNVLDDIVMIWNKEGYVGIGTSNPRTKLEIVVTDGFSTDYNDWTGDSITVDNSGVSTGDDNYGGGITFSKFGNNGVRSSAIAPVQTSGDPDIQGLAFFTHPTVTSSDPIVEKMRIDGDGNVGIGTSTPSETLDVNGNLKVNGDINLSSYGNKIYTPDFSLYQWTSGRMGFQKEIAGSGIFEFFTYDGNSKQTNTLSVYGLANGDTSIANREVISMSYQYTGIDRGQIYTSAAGTGTVDPLEIYTQGNDFQLWLDEDGTVGIGTNSPETPLQIGTADAYDDGLSVINTAGTAGYFSFYGNGTDDDLIVAREGTGGIDIAIQSDGDIALAAYTGGNVGIGTDSPDSNLEVNGDGSVIKSSYDSTASYSKLSFGEVGVERGFIQSIGSTFATADRRQDLEIQSANTDVVLQRSSGNVGIGTSSPTHKLNVIGDVNITDSLIIHGGLNVTDKVYVKSPVDATVFSVNGTGGYTTPMVTTTYVCASPGFGYKCTAPDCSTSSYGQYFCDDWDALTIRGGIVTSQA